MARSLGKSRTRQNLKLDNLPGLGLKLDTTPGLEPGVVRVSGREVRRGDPGQVNLSPHSSQLWFSAPTYKLKGGGK